MAERLNLIGRTFGRLTVLELSSVPRRQQTYWKCICLCGNEKIIRGAHLIAGLIKSCGCLRDEKLSARMTKHGKYKTRLYQTWHNMIQRCENEKDPHFPRWGGRGIKVCAKWHNLDVFIEWALSHGYQKNLTIDRYPDNDGNYEPSNCRWATAKEQSLNKYRRTDKCQSGPK